MNIHPSEQIAIAQEGRIYIYLFIFYLFMNIHPSEQIAIAQEGGIYIYLFFFFYLFIYEYTSFRTNSRSSRSGNIHFFF